VRLTKRQTVILHTTNGPIGGGTFRLRLSGAGLSDSNSAKTSENSQIGENNRSERNSSSNLINIPTSGTLRIRMKDGSTKEIDLSLIREISVKP
ncbi:MAG: hypothetical protein ABI686_04810, partial [Acidobacteriota bacterium]